MAAWTTAIKTWAVGDKTSATALNAQLKDFASAFGAWNSYTPTLAQGTSTNISKTVNYAKYIQVQKFVVCQVSLSATATGTAGSAITATLPVTAAATPSYALNGVGSYYDNGTATYSALVNFGSTTTMQLVRADASTWAVIGNSPNIAVASGDVWTATFVYEAA